MSSSSTSTSPLASKPTESADATKSPPTFDRFKRLENLPDDPVHLQRFVTPRFCSPDRCSGQQPRFEKFALVDEVVSDLFRIKMESMAMCRVAEAPGKLQLAVITALLPQLASLGTTTPSERQEITDLVSIACREYARHHRSSVRYSRFQLTADARFYIDTENIFSQLLERFHSLDGVPLNHDIFPCFCYLSRRTDDLLQLRADLLSTIDDYDPIRRHVLLSATDTADVERRLESGNLALGGSLPGDWRQQLGRLIEFVDGAIAEFIITQYRHFYSDRFCQFSTLISSAQIMEELSSFSYIPSDDGYINPNELGDIVAVAVESFAVSSESAKIMGDGILGRSRLEKNVCMASANAYRIASMIDPSNFGARLNCAAVRLCLAGDAEDSYQWTRVIHDCSAAIYYGSTSFKAYYRRGYALTHLKLWDKAISDFEQALLIEPRNVLVELCLAAAKRRVLA